MTEVETVIDAIQFASRMWDDCDRAQKALPVRPMTETELADTLFGQMFGGETVIDTEEHARLEVRKAQYMATIRAETDKLGMKG